MVTRLITKKEMILKGVKKGSEHSTDSFIVTPPCSFITQTWSIAVSYCNSIFFLSFFRMGLLSVVCVCLFFSSAFAVDRGNFKTCDQSAFCKYVSYTVNQYSIDDLCSVQLQNPVKDHKYSLFWLSDILKIKYSVVVD